MASRKELEKNAASLLPNRERIMPKIGFDRISQVGFD
jgi:hypothetical protein